MFYKDHSQCDLLLKIEIEIVTPYFIGKRYKTKKNNVTQYNRVKCLWFIRLSWTD